MKLRCSLNTHVNMYKLWAIQEERDEVEWLWEQHEYKGWVLNNIPSLLLTNIQTHSTSSKQNGAIHQRLFALCCCFNYTNHRIDEVDWQGWLRLTALRALWDSYASEHLWWQTFVCLSKAAILQNASDDVEERKHTLQERKIFLLVLSLQVPNMYVIFKPMFMLWNTQNESDVKLTRSNNSVWVRCICFFK